MDDKKQFTHIGVEKATQRKIALLAMVRGGNIYRMVGAWADEAWAEALKAGLVNNAMIGKADTPATAKKSRARGEA